MSLTPQEQFDWSVGIASNGSNEHESAMRAAIGKAYYAVLFKLRDSVTAAGIHTYWGHHEQIITFLTRNGPAAVPRNHVADVELLCEKLDEMRVRRGDADYDLSISKAQIVGALGMQIRDGKKIMPLAAPIGTLLATKIAKGKWPRS